MISIDYKAFRMQLLDLFQAQYVHTKKYEHIVPVLISLHWLPVKARIEYKILLITYKIITDCCPLYLKNLVCSIYDLRSTSSNLLRQPRSNTKHYSDRAFSYAAPRLWNSLPDHVRNSQTIEIFKKQIKSHLFKQHYL